MFIHRRKHDDYKYYFSWSREKVVLLYPKHIDRFSEDIDLAVFVGDNGDAVRKTLLKNIESVVIQGLTYLENDERESKGSKFVKQLVRRQVTCPADYHGYLMCTFVLHDRYVQ